MVRTRADNCARKAVAAKAPRKVLGASSSGGAGSSSGMMSPSGKVGKYAGGNAVCDRPTPDWQKGIAGFLVGTPKGKENAKPKEHEGEEEEEEVVVETGEASATATKTCDGSSSQSSSASSDSAGPSSPRRQRNGIIDSDSDDE